MEYQKYRGMPNTLREHRQRLGMTQKQVAELLETDPDWISHWEGGDALPSLISSIKLSVLYRVPVQDLFFDLAKGVKADFEPKISIVPKVSNN